VAFFSSIEIPLHRNVVSLFIMFSGRYCMREA